MLSSIFDAVYHKIHEGGLAIRSRSRPPPLLGSFQNSFHFQNSSALTFLLLFLVLVVDGRSRFEFRFAQDESEKGEKKEKICF